MKINRNYRSFLLLLIVFVCGQQFAQNTYTFTNAGATGNIGPTQAQVNAAYLLTNLNGSVICPSGIQSFTLPVGGNWRITVAGAGGGGSNAFGGRGRIIRGERIFNAGDVLQILVGQKGTLVTSSGGGGGSYVILNPATPILIGGGGAGFLNNIGVALPNTDGNINQNGFNSNCNTGTGGVGGNGGTGTTNGWGGGGGGYTGNGTNASACANTFGRSFTNGGQGGGSCWTALGGFGGGAGTHGNTGGGGGGGGYSGGGGSNQNINPNAGGGGGSFISPSLSNTVNVGLNLNQGYVILEQLCVPGVAPTNITPAPNLSVCSNVSTTLTVSGIGTINWFATPTSTPVLGVGPVFVTPTLSPGTATFYASASNTCGAGPRTPITITVSPGPSITVNSGTVCTGSQFTIAPSGPAVSYTYLPTGPIVTPTANTNYTVIGTGLDGCVNYAGAVVSVSVMPLPTITVNSGTLCAGQVFTLMPAGAVSYTYSSGSQTVSPVVTTTYYVSGSDANGCVASSAAVSVITVAAVPSVTVNGPNAMCIGQTIILSAVGANSYSWNTGAITPSISVSPTTNISYTVTGTGLNFCPGMPVVKNIVVHPKPNITITAPTTVICKGESILLTANSADTYSWNTGALTPTILVTPTITTSYTVIGTNTTTGCQSTATRTVQVNICTEIGEMDPTIQNTILYPNPTNGEFVIEISGKAEAVLFNTLGQIVMKTNLNAGKNEINVSDLAKGVYFVKISYNQNSKIIRLVKD